MPAQLFKAKDKVTGNLNAGISPSDLSIPLETGDGANFPQPYTGTASSVGSRTVLNDTGDLANLQTGDFIRNVTDGSWAFVVTPGANSITTTRLQGGSDNTWANGDEWRANEFILTLAKIDSNGNDTAYEEILVSNRTSDTITVPTGGRGYNGTIAQAFNAEDYVQLRVTAPYLEKAKEVLRDIQLQADTLRTEFDALEAALGSDENDAGASLIAIEDEDDNFEATDVEGALAELAPRILPDAGDPGDVLISDGDFWTAQPPVKTVVPILAPTADSSAFGTLGSATDAPTGYKKTFTNGELAAGDVVHFEFVARYSQLSSPKNVVMKINLGSTALVTFATQSGSSGTFWARGKFIVRATSGANNIEHTIDYDSTLPKVMTAITEAVNTSVTLTPNITFAADTTSPDARVDYFHVYKISAPA